MYFFRFWVMVPALGSAVIGWQFLLEGAHVRGIAMQVVALACGASSLRAALRAEREDEAAEAASGPDSSRGPGAQGGS